MFNFLKSKKTANTKPRIKGFQGGAKYKLLTGTDQQQREKGIAETVDEQDILTWDKRLQLLDLCRNAVRNSPAINTILKQIDNCVVGTRGGKFIWAGDESEEMEKVKGLFWNWTHKAEFFDGLSYRNLLSIILKSILINGDICLVMDDGLFKDSGRLILFEADEIGNLSKDALARYYGKSATQSMGIVRDLYGCFSGVTVSKSQRGKEIFDSEKSYCLKCDPEASYFESPFILPRTLWRTNQNRGITALASSIQTALDLEDTILAECLSVKKNSQLLGQIFSSSKGDDDIQIPSAFDTADIENMTPEELEKAIQAEREAQNQTVQFDEVHSIGANIIQLPDNLKMELLDSKRPNPNVQQFIDYLSYRVCGTLGIGGIYATFRSDGDTKLQQMLSWQTYKVMQKELEQINDWVFYRFVQWQIKRGNINPNNLPSDFMHYVRWDSPEMTELDELTHQNAIEKKFLNGLTTYQAELGFDWQKILKQQAKEVSWAKENGINLAYFNLKSGGESEMISRQTQEQPE